MRYKFIAILLMPFLKAHRCIKEIGWYRFLTLVVSGVASLAAVATAIVSWKTMDTNDAMHDKIKALQKETLILNASVSNTLDQVMLYGDMIAAAGGDRYAYLSAVDKMLLGDNITDRSIHQTEQLLDSITKFEGHPTNNPIIKSVMYANELSTNDTDVAALLRSPNRDDRLYAINDVYILRLNNLIPNIAKLVEVDSDMNVVQYALYVVTETLRNNISDEDVDSILGGLHPIIDNPHNFCDNFNDIWSKHGQSIKSRRPRELKRVQVQGDTVLFYEFLYDPERNENIPLPERNDCFWFEIPTSDQLK